MVDNRIMTYKIAERLKELRNKMGISQAKLGEAIGLDQRFIGNIEAGRKLISINTLVLLADFFGVSADYILGRDNY